MLVNIKSFAQYGNNVTQQFENGQHHHSSENKTSRNNTKYFSLCQNIKSISIQIN